MKNLIGGVIIGVLLNGLVVFAAEKIVANPLVKVASPATRFASFDVSTTKVSTPEGTYRVFTVDNGTGVGITAIKIN